ncbi:MAG: hypothetical protein SGI77_26235, partial [Pirellulaceae bacterium]|nr:hypothetical protein [Pirellulaceae bacterium]
MQIEHLERRALLAMLPIAPVFHEDAPISVFPVKDQRGFTRSVSESYAHGRATAVTISDGMSLNDREQTSFIVDNSHPGYRETGAWVNSAITGFNGSSTRIAVAANAAATWNAPSLIP